MWPFRRKRGRELFRSHELAVVDALRAALPPEAALQLDRQVDAVEVVGRLFKDAEIYPGPKGPGLERLDKANAFANRSLEYKLATLGLKGASGAGKVTVTAVMGHAAVWNFRPPPRELGPLDSIVVTKTTLHLDPSQPDDGSETRRRLERLAPAIRSQLESAWAERPTWAASLVEPDGAYEIDLDDGAYLMLAQLEDTTFVVAGVDPPRPGVRRYEPSGELIGEYATVQEAFMGDPAS